MVGTACDLIASDGPRVAPLHADARRARGVAQLAWHHVLTHGRLDEPDTARARRARFQRGRLSHQSVPHLDEGGRGGYQPRLGGRCDSLRLGLESSGRSAGESRASLTTRPSPPPPISHDLARSPSTSSASPFPLAPPAPRPCCRPWTARTASDKRSRCASSASSRP